MHISRRRCLIGASNQRRKPCATVPRLGHHRQKSKQPRTQACLVFVEHTQRQGQRGRDRHRHPLPPPFLLFYDHLCIKWKSVNCWTWQVLGGRRLGEGRTSTSRCSRTPSRRSCSRSWHRLPSGSRCRFSQCFHASGDKDEGGEMNEVLSDGPCCCGRRASSRATGCRKSRTTCGVGVGGAAAAMVVAGALVSKRRFFGPLRRATSTNRTRRRRD